MANEATLIVETDVPVMMTCANGTGIEKGTLLTLSDPNTAAAASADGAPVAGIAAEEKIASDGKTKIAVYRGGQFKVKASGSITAGDPLAIALTNYVYKAATNEEDIFGTALETASDEETFLAELKPFGISLA